MKKEAPRIDYSTAFNKQLKIVPLKIKIAFRKRLALFLENPFNPLLNNHSLTGKYSGYRSINVTGDWRAVYSDKGQIIIFITLGTHSQLYK